MGKLGLHLNDLTPKLRLSDSVNITPVTFKKENPLQHFSEPLCKASSKGIFAQYLFVPVSGAEPAFGGCWTGDSCAPPQNLGMVESLNPLEEGLAPRTSACEN